MQTGTAIITGTGKYAGIYIGTYICIGGTYTGICTHKGKCIHKDKCTFLRTCTRLGKPSNNKKRISYRILP